jgi:hypothetical protein
MEGQKNAEKSLNSAPIEAKMLKSTPIWDDLG